MKRVNIAANDVVDKAEQVSKQINTTTYAFIKVAFRMVPTDYTDRPVMVPLCENSLNISKSCNAK